MSDTVEGLSPLAQHHGVTLTVDIADDTRSLQVDPDQFQRVIANVVQNAVQHTSAGDTVTVTAHANDHETSIEIIDTGEGISPDHLPHVFDAFYRADNARSEEDHGSGLGLTIAKAIVEAHGGSISLQSEIAQGSRVTITLPARGSNVRVAPHDGKIELASSI